MQRRKFIQLSTVGAIGVATLPLIACEQSTTLKQIAAALEPSAKAYKATLSDLLNAKVISDATFATLNTQADELIKEAKKVGDYLIAVSITSANKAEVVTKIADGVSLFSGILQNPLLVGVPQTSLAVRILNVALLSLRQASAIVEALNAPGVSLSATGSKNKAIPSDKVIIKDAPKVDVDVAKAIAAQK